MKPIVYVLVGPIACGKSTLAKQLALEMQAVVINDDAIVTAMAGGVYAWKKPHKRIYKAVEIAIAQAALLAGENVVVDKPNFSREQRRRWIALANTFDARAVCASFEWPSPSVSAARRVAVDARGLSVNHWLSAAKRHYKNYQSPSLDEGFEKIVLAGEWDSPQTA